MVSRLREPRYLLQTEKFGDGPAAVFGDETCNKPLPFDKLRVGRRKDA